MDRFTRSGSRAPRTRPRLPSLSPSPSLPLARTRSGNATLPSLDRGHVSLSVGRVPGVTVSSSSGAEGRWRGRRKKKEEDLGQFLSHKPADRAAPIKNASLRMAIGPQRGSGGNAEPRALFLHPRARPPPPPVYRYPLSLFRGTALLVPLRSPLPPPTFSPRLAPTRSFASPRFFLPKRGKNARRPSIGRGDR